MQRAQKALESKDLNVEQLDSLPECANDFKFESLLVALIGYSENLAHFHTLAVIDYILNPFIHVSFWSFNTYTLILNLKSILLIVPAPNVKLPEKIDLIVLVFFKSVVILNMHYQNSIKIN